MIPAKIISTEEEFIKLWKDFVSKREKDDEDADEVIDNGDIEESICTYMQYYYKDDKEIDFDFENIEVGYGKIKGFYKIKNTIAYGLGAGGDWENPVTFVIYFDKDNNLQIYAPKAHENYNIKCNCAYGSEDHWGNNLSLEEKYDKDLLDYIKKTYSISSKEDIENKIDSILLKEKKLPFSTILDDLNNNFLIEKE